jgi:hypothetical protein
MTNDKPLQVAIVGAAPSSRLQAPFKDPNWEIWACSAGNTKVLPRITGWFELHDLADLTGPRWSSWTAEYLEILRNAPYKIYMQEVNPYVPNAVSFPKDEIVNKWPDAPYTSSFAWMMAYAIYLGAKKISIFGVDLTAGAEYEYERPGAQYWIGRAREMGIEVFIPSSSDLGYEIPLYGYSDAQPIARKLKEQCYELRERIRQYDEQITQHQNRISQIVQERQQLQGALNEAIYFRRTFIAWSGPDE